MAITTYTQGALTGNLITIEIGGQVIGLIQSLQAQEDFGLQPVSGMGQVTPVEHAPSISRINLSCETIYISPGAALKATSPGVYEAFGDAKTPARISNNNGTANTLEELGIVPETAGDILKGAVFNIVVYKKAGGASGSTSAVVRTYIDCSYSGGSISFQKHQIVMQSATFMALDYEAASSKNGAFSASASSNLPGSF